MALSARGRILVAVAIPLLGLAVVGISSVFTTTQVRHFSSGIIKNTFNL